MCCIFATAFIISWWIITIYQLFKLSNIIYENRDDPGKRKFEYESLDSVFEEGCTNLTARHAYLLRISYGDRSKRFSIPHATITVDFLNREKIVMATAKLRPELLTKNHRSYIWHPRSNRKPFLLFVVLKRRTPMGQVNQVRLNHNQHLNTIFVNSVYLVRLADQAVLGALVSQSICCSGISTGIPPQLYPLRELTHPDGLPLFAGDYIGPQQGLNLMETAATVCLGMSTAFVKSTTFIYDKSESPYLRLEWRLSRALTSSLRVALWSWTVMSFSMTVYHFLVKRLAARVLNIGYFWFLNHHLLPNVLFLASICFDAYTIGRLLYLTGVWSALLQLPVPDEEQQEHYYPSPSLPSSRQEQLWLLVMVSAASIYLLITVAVLMILTLNRYYDTVNFCDLDFERQRNGTKEQKRRKRKLLNIGSSLTPSSSSPKSTISKSSSSSSSSQGSLQNITISLE